MFCMIKFVDLSYEPKYNALGVVNDVNRLELSRNWSEKKNPKKQTNKQKKQVDGRSLLYIETDSASL